MPDSYAQVVEENRRALAQVRLSDRNDHFPYKYDQVVQLLDENPPMGPGTPGGADGQNDTSRTAVDYMSAGIAEASRDYIDAQAAYLEDPDDETRQGYETARDRLNAARLDHRQNREDGFTIGAAARRGGAA